MDDLPSRRHQLRKSQLIEFSNVAAGHEGVLASQSGDLIVKPCKDSEVTFYQQTWKWDPSDDEFAYFMPKFYGTLSLQEHPPSSSSLPSAAMATAAASTPAMIASALSPTSSTPTLAPPGSSRRASHVSNLSAPGTPKSAASRIGHGRSPSRSSIISHLPVDVDLAPTKPPKAWEPTHGAKIVTDTAVVLENVASGVHRPNILDVKIGARLWADDAHPAKVQKLEKDASETTSGSLGFRIAGMKVWDGMDAFEKRNRAAMDEQVTKPQQVPDSQNIGTGAAEAAKPETKRDLRGLPLPTIREDDYASYDKAYGRAMNVENVRYGFENYFLRPQAGISPSYSREVMLRFIDDLNGLIDIMSRIEIRMYSASLLFVYEGDGKALREDFRRENRMLREARLQREAIEKGMNFVAISDSSVGIFKGSSTVHVGESVQQLLAKAQSSGVGEAVSLHAGIAAGQDQGGLNKDGPDDYFGVKDEDEDEDEDDQDEDEEPTNLLPKIQALKVIDFAHAKWTVGQGPDENFLAGARNVLKILEDIVASIPEE